MFGDIDLRELAEISTKERSFLSVYISGPQSVAKLDKTFSRLRKALTDEGNEADERVQFDENVKSITGYLQQNPLHNGGLCLFSAWLCDFFKAISINVHIPDLVIIDSSPFIRPLAELQDEYENVAVVVADAKKARIFLISSAVETHEEKIKGNIKNHVRKGGWSQQRYERRRDKQLLLYAKEIVDALCSLEKKENFRRILFVGSKEIIKAVYDNVPQQMATKITSKPMDIGKADTIIHKDIMDIFKEQERKSERDLWEKIRGEYLKGGLGVVGLEDVYKAALGSRIEEMVVERTFTPEGKRCRECENFYPGTKPVCPFCRSDAVFTIDLMEALVDLLKNTNASIDFTDHIPTLHESGQIAALLRY